MTDQEAGGQPAGAGLSSVPEILKAVQGSVPFVFRIDGAVPDSFATLDGILETFLAELGQETIQEALSYCMKELVLNAEKANIKRIYFEEHNLKITRREDYEKGMKSFHAEMSQNLAHFLGKLRERSMSIDVLFHAAGGTFTVSVRNDALLAPMEEARIRERVSRARTFSSFTDALETSVDHTEGAGLGIMILLQFLKSIGLDEAAFSVGKENGRTVSTIVIPVSDVRLDQVRLLTEELVRHIDSLPHFPENVVSLMRLTQDANARVTDISYSISKDPSLTAELLKHVNSSYYGLPARITNISQAVKLIGMRSLHQLLYSFGFHMIMDRHHSRMKSLWEHSMRTAFYAFLLARDVKRKPEILDDAYVAGILHDLGFIAIVSLQPRTEETMRRFCSEKNIPAWVLERFTFGMKHADIGALIAQKWNFPDQLVEGIKYHHDPQQASGEHRDVVFCVYLANAVCDVERGLASWQQLDQAVLNEFGLRTEAQFLDMASTLKNTFEKHQEKVGSRGT